MFHHIFAGRYLYVWRVQMDFVKQTQRHRFGAGRDDGLCNDVCPVTML